MFKNKWIGQSAAKFRIGKRSTTNGSSKCCEKVNIGGVVMELYFYKGQPTRYSVEKDGRVYSHITNKYMNGSIGKNGYKKYLLTLPNHEKKALFAHRMVMETYCPNPNSKFLEINHIDGNKLNNDISNLEWTTRIEN